MGMDLCSLLETTIAAFHRTQQLLYANVGHRLLAVMLSMLTIWLIMFGHHLDEFGHGLTLQEVLRYQKSHPPS